MKDWIIRLFFSLDKFIFAYSLFIFAFSFCASFSVSLFFFALSSFLLSFVNSSRFLFSILFTLRKINIILTLSDEYDVNCARSICIYRILLYFVRDKNWRLATWWLKTGNYFMLWNADCIVTVPTCTSVQCRYKFVYVQLVIDEGMNEWMIKKLSRHLSMFRKW